MKHAFDLGFVALTDAAPLIVAREHGYFADEGLNISLRREVSWATIRDKVSAGLYQGAHMLAPMAVATSGGIGVERSGIAVPMSLNANSASLGISARLAEAMSPTDPADPSAAKALGEAIARRREPVARFAVVFPYSLHNYMLRNWAVSAGLDPDIDIRIVVTPPTAIAARLRAGEIDGFCVGAPWGALCEQDAGARIILNADAFRPGAPDKVLGLSQAWADAEPQAALAVTRAVLRGGAWAGAPENAPALAALLARAEYIGATESLIARNLGSSRTAIAFSHDITFPSPSHAEWIVGEMHRWGQIHAGANIEAALASYRPDLYEKATGAIDLGG